MQTSNAAALSRKSRALWSEVASASRSHCYARIGSYRGWQQDARAEGYRRLLDGRFLGYEYQHEYAELGRSVLPLLHNGDVEVWESLIFDGPPLSQDELEKRSARELQPEEQLDQAVPKYREVWQLNILSAIGPESLSVRAGARLAQFVNTYGEPPHPDSPSYSSSWSGPDSPVAAEDWSRRASMRFWHC